MENGECFFCGWIKGEGENGADLRKSAKEEYSLASSKADASDVEQLLEEVKSLRMLVKSLEEENKKLKLELQTQSSDETIESLRARLFEEQERRRLAEIEISSLKQSNAKGRLRQSLKNQEENTKSTVLQRGTRPSLTKKNSLAVEVQSKGRGRRLKKTD